MTTVGIDIGGRTHLIARCRDGMSRADRETLRVSQSRAGVASLDAWLERQPEPVTLMAMESSGHYWRALASHRRRRRVPRDIAFVDVFLEDFSGQTAGVRQNHETVGAMARLVEAGKAPSVSAVVNDALEARRQRDQRSRRLWREAAERADHAKVARMMAHIEAQVAEFPPSHR